MEYRTQAGECYCGCGYCAITVHCKLHQAGCHRICHRYSAPTPQPLTPLLQSQRFRIYCAIVAVFFGSATLGALAYGAPVMAFMWGFLLVSLIGLPIILAGFGRR